MIESAVHWAMKLKGHIVSISRLLQFIALELLDFFGTCIHICFFLVHDMLSVSPLYPSTLYATTCLRRPCLANAMAAYQNFVSSLPSIRQDRPNHVI